MSTMADFLDEFAAQVKAVAAKICLESMACDE
jgi:hypothetical protein